jgi:iron-sulfur cluster insertion protein
MQKVIMSQEAYDEFKGFLDENKVETYNIRINFAGSSCGGPVFNISIEDKVEEDDVVEKINDISFLIKKPLIDDFEGFTILSTDENNGRGLSLKALNAPEGDCGGCTGCH